MVSTGEALNPLETLGKLRRLLLQAALCSTSATSRAPGDLIALGKPESAPPHDGQVADPDLVKDLSIMIEAVYRAAEARYKNQRDDIETIARRIRAYDLGWPAEAIALWERVPLRDVARIRARMVAQGS